MAQKVRYDQGMNTDTRLTDLIDSGLVNHTNALDILKKMGEEMDKVLDDTIYSWMSTGTHAQYQSVTQLHKLAVEEARRGLD